MLLIGLGLKNRSKYKFRNETILTTLFILLGRHKLIIVVAILIIIATIVLLKYSKNKKYLIVSLSMLLLIALFVIPMRQKIYNKFNRYFYKQIYSNSKCSTNWNTVDVERDDYKTKHLPAAIKLTDNKFIASNKQLNLLLHSNKLLPVNNDVGFEVRKLKYSSNNLHPVALKRLKELGTRFSEKNRGNSNETSSIKISSLTRTEIQQEQLRGAMPRAATKGKSTHSFGASFDIVSIHYKKSRTGLLSNLGFVLSEMQEEGKILICPERACLHITVIK
jgi:hypothetical protein